MVADLCENYPSNPNELTDFNDSLAFIPFDCDEGGNTLYITQGLNGTMNHLGGYHVRALMATNDHLFFASTNEDYGEELSTNAGGTAEGTYLLKNINEGSDPGGFAVAGDYLIFNTWHGKRTLFRLKIKDSSPVSQREIAPASSLNELQKACLVNANQAKDPSF